MNNFFDMKSLSSVLFSFALLWAPSCLAFTNLKLVVSRPLLQNPSVDFTRTQASSTDEFSDEGTFLDPISDGLTDVCILGLRLGTCALMIHHGIDKLDHVEGFSANVVAKFFPFLPGPPSFWTISAAATQVVGAGLLGIGVLARPVALSMMATMVTAVAFHLLNTGPEGFPLGVPVSHSYNFELAAMYVAVLAYFSAAGAGAYSVDEKLLGGELKLYQSLLNKVFDNNEVIELDSAAYQEQEKGLKWMSYLDNLSNKK